MGHSAGSVSGRKHLGKQRADSAEGWSPALLREGQMGMLWVLGRSQGALLGQDHQVQQFQSFAQCRQEKCCVL